MPQRRRRHEGPDRSAGTVTVAAPCLSDDVDDRQAAPGHRHLPLGAWPQLRLGRATAIGDLDAQPMSVERPLHLQRPVGSGAAVAQRVADQLAHDEGGVVAAVG
jgi:hypothetical protein